MINFPFEKQMYSMDCGPACLSMVFKYYGKAQSSSEIRDLCNIQKDGSSLGDLADAAESLGLRSYGIKCTFQQLRELGSPPCIVPWKDNHFVVLYKIRKQFFYIADPASGKYKVTEKEFLKNWMTQCTAENNGYCIFFEITKKLYTKKNENKKNGVFHYLKGYAKPHIKFFFHVFLGLFVSSGIQLIFPFLTQTIVDVGIGNLDLSFIALILIAQLFLQASNILMSFLKDWILLHVTTRINIAAISDFLEKLLKLPLQYYDHKNAGDIMQRVSDHKRIESFLTNGSFHITFAIGNLIVFAVILNIYHS